MADKKARLINMVKKGGAIEDSKKERKIKLKRIIALEQKNLSIKESTLENLEGTATAYSSLIMNLDSEVKRNLAAIKNMLLSSKSNVKQLRFASKKKEVIDLALSLGFNKAHIEILKKDNVVYRSQIDEYEKLRGTIKREVNILKNEVKTIQESIDSKEKALEENEPDK